jgi:hypothetical protein
MMEKIIGGLTLRQILVALAILAVFLVLAWLFSFFLTRTIKRLTRKTKTKLDDAVFTVIRKPLFAVIILAGLYLAVRSLGQETDLWLYVGRWLATLLSLLGVYAVVAEIDTVITWYRKEVARKKVDVGFSIRLLRVVWFIILIFAVWLAALAVLGIWGLEVGAATGWLGEHGWRIVLIIVFAMLTVIAMGEIVPRIIVRTLARRPDETKEEVKK